MRWLMCFYFLVLLCIQKHNTVTVIIAISSTSINVPIVNPSIVYCECLLPGVIPPTVGIICGWHFVSSMWLRSHTDTTISCTPSTTIFGLVAPQFSIILTNLELFTGTVPNMAVAYPTKSSSLQSSKWLLKMWFWLMGQLHWSSKRRSNVPSRSLSLVRVSLC